MQQIFRKREKETTKWAATIHQVSFPETNTAWLPSNHPTLQVYCITVRTEGMRFALSWRLQTPASPFTLQQNFFEVIRAQTAWEGVRVRANFAASSMFGITMAIIFSVPLFSYFLPTWCNYNKMVSAVLPVHRAPRRQNPFQNQINCFFLDPAQMSVCKAAYQN